MLAQTSPAFSQRNQRVNRIMQPTVRQCAEETEYCIGYYCNGGLAINANRYAEVCGGKPASMVQPGVESCLRARSAIKNINFAACGSGAMREQIAAAVANYGNFERNVRSASRNCQVEQSRLELAKRCHAALIASDGAQNSAIRAEIDSICGPSAGGTRELADRFFNAGAFGLSDVRSPVDMVSSGQAGARRPNWRQVADGVLAGYIEIAEISCGAEDFTITRINNWTLDSRENTSMSGIRTEAEEAGRLRAERDIGIIYARTDCLARPLPEFGRSWEWIQGAAPPCRLICRPGNVNRTSETCGPEFATARLPEAQTVPMFLGFNMGQQAGLVESRDLRSTAAAPISIAAEASPEIQQPQPETPEVPDIEAPPSQCATTAPCAGNCSGDGGWRDLLCRQQNNCWVHGSNGMISTPNLNTINLNKSRFESGLVFCLRDRTTWKYMPGAPSGTQPAATAQRAQSPATGNCPKCPSPPAAGVTWVDNLICRQENQCCVNGSSGQLSKGNKDVITENRGAFTSRLTFKLCGGGTCAYTPVGTNDGSGCGVASTGVNPPPDSGACTPAEFDRCHTNFENTYKNAATSSECSDQYVACISEIFSRCEDYPSSAINQNNRGGMIAPASQACSQAIPAADTNTQTRSASVVCSQAYDIVSTYFTFSNGVRLLRSYSLAEIKDLLNANKSKWENPGRRAIFDSWTPDELKHSCESYFSVRIEEMQERREISKDSADTATRSRFCTRAREILANSRQNIFQLQGASIIGYNSNITGGIDKFCPEESAQVRARIAYHRSMNTNRPTVGEHLNTEISNLVSCLCSP